MMERCAGWPPPLVQDDVGPGGQRPAVASSSPVSWTTTSAPAEQAEIGPQSHPVSKPQCQES